MNLVQLSGRVALAQNDVILANKDLLHFFFVVLQPRPVKDPEQESTRVAVERREERVVPVGDQQDLAVGLVINEAELRVLYVLAREVVLVFWHQVGADQVLAQILLGDATSQEIHIFLGNRLDLTNLRLTANARVVVIQPSLLHLDLDRLLWILELKGQELEARDRIGGWVLHQCTPCLEQLRWPLLNRLPLRQVRGGLLARHLALHLALLLRLLELHGNCVGRELLQGLVCPCIIERRGRLNVAQDLWGLLDRPSVLDRIAQRIYLLHEAHILLPVCGLLLRLGRGVELWRLLLLSFHQLFLGLLEQEFLSRIFGGQLGSRNLSRWVIRVVEGGASVLLLPSRVLAVVLDGGGVILRQRRLKACLLLGHNLLNGHWQLLLLPREKLAILLAWGIALLRGRG